jgi:aspartate ammonia-lyase
VSSSTTDTRIEHDSLGGVDVPAAALYGAHTTRALENFSVSGVATSQFPAVIAALGQVKAAAAGANLRLGVLEPEIGAAVVGAARAVARNEHDSAFPVDLLQGGGGTALNMNTNEVVANLASIALGGEPDERALVHPNDHANRSQSTNDVIPTALALATVVSGQRLGLALRELAASCDRLAERFGDLSRLGRTCLQDAVPLSVEQTHGAHAAAIRRVAGALDASLEELLAVPLGATAIGTGVGAPAGYREAAIELLAAESGLEVRSAENLFDALQNFDPYVDVAAQVVRAALVLAKIAADFRFLSSPPVGELQLPRVQVGSSIMPGKVNPVIPELVLQVSFEARGMATVVEAAAAAGELELNVMELVIAKHLLRSMGDLGRVADLFDQRCLSGLEWQAERLEAHLAGSRADSVRLAALHGYARVAKELGGDR